LYPTHQPHPPPLPQLNSFQKYFSGEKRAPVLTLFVGGNHEASNHLQELPHGGWVAPNIYFLGRASVVDLNGLRIGGLGGIYNDRHYRQGLYEAPPYSADTLRSVYYTRALDTFRLCQLQPPSDFTGPPDTLPDSFENPLADPSGRAVGAFLSHDWPTGIAQHGNISNLLRRKRFLADEIANDSLGSPAGATVLSTLQPSHWFAAHLHTKFAALVRHPPPGLVPGGPQEPGRIPGTGRATKFLSLDKCLPARDFLQIVQMPCVRDGPAVLSYDAEWLAVLRSTAPLLASSAGQVHTPPFPDANPNFNTAATLAWRPGPDGIKWVLEKAKRIPPAGTLAVEGVPLAIPHNWAPSRATPSAGRSAPVGAQTIALLAWLELPPDLDSRPSQQLPAGPKASDTVSHRASLARRPAATVPPLPPAPSFFNGVIPLPPSFPNAARLGYSLAPPQSLGGNVLSCGMSGMAPFPAFVVGAPYPQPPPPIGQWVPQQPHPPLPANPPPAFPPVSAGAVDSGDPDEIDLDESGDEGSASKRHKQ